jgi:hypothetical protein
MSSPEKKALKALKALKVSFPRAGLPVLDVLVGPVTNGTISPPTRYGLANVPFVIQRPRHLAWSGHRPVTGDVVFSKLSKLLYQEDALSAPC